MVTRIYWIRGTLLWETEEYAVCGIAGFCDYVEELTGESYLWGTLAKRMAARLKTCGSDSGLTVSAHTAFAQTHFASEKPVQPVCCVRDHVRYTIVCDGELYNAAQLRHELRGLGARFETQGDAEVMLQAYLYFGAHCAEKLNGVYAFAVEGWTSERNLSLPRSFGRKAAVLYRGQRASCICIRNQGAI